MPKVVEVDAVQRHIGVYGKYQFRLTLYIFAAKPSVAFYMIAIVFLAPPVSYYCGDEQENRMVCPCENPVYNRTIFTDTMVMKWNLICEKKWLVSFHQSIFQSGTLFGSLMFGQASDRFGRKNPLLFAVVLQVVSAIGAIFAPDFWTFTLLRFIVGLSIGGTMVTSFVLLMEFVGTKYRELIAALYQLPFNVGHMLLPVISYYIRDFVNFQWVLLSSALILLPYFCLLPETPRWLLAAKRTEEAIKIIEYVATINNVGTKNVRRDIEAYQALIEKKKHLKKGTIADLFRTPNIRRNIICMAVNWVACSYSFYGMAQYVSVLTGNIFLNVLASASLAALGTLASVPLLAMMGRKPLIIIQNFICAGCCLLLCVFSSYKTLSICLATVGIMASFIVFVVVYLYCGELFPTVVRNAAVGFCSMMARIGSIVAPFVINTKDIGDWAPPLLFSTIPLLAGFLAFLMPETQGHELMSTLEEAEKFGTTDHKVPASTGPLLTAPGSSGRSLPEKAELPETKDESGI